VIERSLVAATAFLCLAFAWTGPAPAADVPLLTGRVVDDAELLQKREPGADRRHAEGARTGYRQPDRGVDRADDRRVVARAVRCASLRSGEAG